MDVTTNNGRTVTMAVGQIWWSPESEHVRVVRDVTNDIITVDVIDPWDTSKDSCASHNEGAWRSFVDHGAELCATMELAILSIVGHVACKADYLKIGQIWRIPGSDMIRVVTEPTGIFVGFRLLGMLDTSIDMSLSVARRKWEEWAKYAVLAPAPRKSNDGT